MLTPGLLGQENYIVRKREMNTQDDFQFEDDMGRGLFDVKNKKFGNTFSFIDKEGGIFGILKRGTDPESPSFELYDESKRLLGKVFMKFKGSIINNDHDFVLEDNNRRMIAIAVGDFVNLEYYVIKEGLGGNGVRNVAKVSRKNMNDAYAIHILDPNFSQLTLLEFTMAIAQSYWLR